MPDRDVILTDQHDRFVGDVISAGRYRNASEVVSEGLRLLERREVKIAAKLTRLRALVAEAEAEYARGEYIEIADDQLGDWLASLGQTGRTARAA